MPIKGLQINSLVDYPSNITAVIFFGGCNFNCGYCHNKALIERGGESVLTVDEVLQKIKKRAGFLDAVTLSGGEPLLNNEHDLLKLILPIKEMGLKLKLDTNGTNFELLTSILPHFNYVAMDIKAPLEKYGEVCNTVIASETKQSILKSIELIKNFGGEFRTTVLPSFTLSDIEKICNLIKGGKANYYLQQYREVDGFNGKPHPPKFFYKAKEIAQSFGIATFLRGI